MFTIMTAGAAVCCCRWLAMFVTQSYGQPRSRGDLPNSACPERPFCQPVAAPQRDVPSRWQSRRRFGPVTPRTARRDGQRAQRPPGRTRPAGLLVCWAAREARRRTQRARAQADKRAQRTWRCVGRFAKRRQRPAHARPANPSACQTQPHLDLDVTTPQHCGAHSIIPVFSAVIASRLACAFSCSHAFTNLWSPRSTCSTQPTSEASSRERTS